MSSSKNNLPKTWEHSTIGKVYQVVGGGTPSTQIPKYWGGNIPWITSADIEDVKQIDIRKYVSEEGIAESATNKVPAKTLLVVTRVGLGKVAIAETPICFSQDLQGLIQNPEFIAPEYTLYFLSYELQILKFQGRGTTISGITKKQLKDLMFPVPPINEQRRIVAKIEELFAELEAGVASLELARAQLQTYRQALLKHAFEGKLTAQWRTANAGQLEDAATLLQRIQAERQAHHQAELAAWKEAVETWEANGKPGKKPTNPSPPKDLPLLTPTELADLPPLPAGWAWVKAEKISEFITKGTTPRKDELYSGDGEIPFIKVYNLTHNGSLDFSINPTFVSKSTHNGFLARSRVFPGDVLMNIVGPPLGKVSVVPSNFPEWNINQAIARFRSQFVANKFLSNYLLFGQTIRNMMNKSKATAGQFNLTLEICREIPIPLCSQLEQTEIVRELEARLSVIDQLELTITTALQQAEALRQSILKKAFAGQLVPQDPTDEPASALLARIRAVKDTAAKNGNR